MGPVTAHIAGKLAPHCGAFLGGTFTPETSINSPAAMRGNTDTQTGDDTRKKRDNRLHTGRQREKQGRAQLFSKLAAYKLLFAYLLFESFGRRSCATPSTSRREDPRRSRRSPGQRRTRFTLHRHLKNPALNKGRIQDSTSSLPCNRNTSPL